MKSRLLKSLLFLMATSAVLNSFAMMQVYVKTLTGITITVNIDPNATTNQLYQACSDVLGIAVDRIRLILAGKKIPNDESKMKIYGIEKETVMHVVSRNPAAESADSSVTIFAGENSISVNYTPGKTTNHDMYLKAAALEVPGWEIASLEKLATSSDGAVFGAIKINNDDNVFSINPKNEELYANLIRTTSLPTRVDDSSPAGAGSGSSAPMVEKLYSVKIFADENYISVNYTPGKTTNHDMYLQAAALGWEIAALQKVRLSGTIIHGTTMHLVVIGDDENLFYINPENEKLYANLIRTTSLPTRVDDSSPAGAGSGSSADLRAETALEEAVAIEAIEEAVAIEAIEEAVAIEAIKEVLSDIETIDLNNLAHVEAKLQQLGATYNGLTTIDLDEKQAILRRILEYKKIKGFKAIHTLLKHNQFKI